MIAADFSGFAALAGPIIGGLTTFAAAWVTQRQQANVQWFLRREDKTARALELYHQFIEEASKFMWMRGPVVLSSSRASELGKPWHELLQMQRR